MNSKEEAIRLHKLRDEFFTAQEPRKSEIFSVFLPTIENAAMIVYNRYCGENGKAQGEFYDDIYSVLCIEAVRALKGWSVSRGKMLDYLEERCVSAGRRYCQTVENLRKGDNEAYKNQLKLQSRADTSTMLNYAFLDIKPMLKNEYAQMFGYMFGCEDGQIHSIVDTAKKFGQDRQKVHKRYQRLLRNIKKVLEGDYNFERLLEAYQINPEYKGKNYKKAYDYIDGKDDGQPHSYRQAEIKFGIPNTNLRHRAKTLQQQEENF